MPGYVGCLSQNLRIQSDKPSSTALYEVSARESPRMRKWSVSRSRKKILQRLRKVTIGQ